MNDIVITEKTLDVKKVFRQKAPGLSRWIPGFVYAYLKKKLHQQEMNEFLFRNRDKVGLDFVDAAIERLGVDIKVTGLENVPPAGKYTLAANHPLGGPEGLALMQVVGRIRKDLTFLSNDILMSIPNLKMLFTPVNKHGSNTEYLKLFNKAFEAENIVLIFPAGMVSRKQGGKIRDLVWKSSFISRAVKYHRDIIPCYVNGKNSAFFYNLARFRTWIGLKANLEMFLLPDEMFKQEGRPLKMTFGKAIPYTIFDNRMNKHDWAGLMKKYVYELGENPELVFDDSYILAKTSLNNS